jgi:hypothetical protein
MRKVILISLLLLSTFNGFSQTIIQNSGWFALFNSTKLSNRWGLALDVQVRSADNWGYVRNILIRPGVTYYLNDRSNVTAGYLFTNTHTEQAMGDTDFQEHRVWQQYVFNHKIKSSFLTHRARLEQRFIETAADDIFSQRARYFIRYLKPLADYGDSFNKGLFIALQNEVFLNIQNKDKLNKSIFDQNRFYIAAGYRISKKMDVEAGYLNQYVNSVGSNTSNRVAQLAIYTRF